MGALFTLQPNENVIHPQPFVPTDPYRLIITTQRVVHIDKRRIELPAAQISFTGRSSDRPYLNICVLLGILALPCLIVGLVFYLQTRNAKTSVPDLTKTEKNSMVLVAKHQAAVDAAGDAKTKKYGGIALLVVAAACGYGIKKLHKKAFYVILSAGQGKATKIKTKSEQEQNQILTTVQAAITAAKMMPPTPAAAPAAPAKR